MGIAFICARLPPDTYSPNIHRHVHCLPSFERGDRVPFDLLCFYMVINNWVLCCCLGEYFPKAHNDTITVWEDESVSFDVIGNDYFAGGSASIVETSMVSLESLLKNL